MKNEQSKFVLRIPSGLHNKLKNLAVRNQTSLNKTCVEALEQGSESLGSSKDKYEPIKKAYPQLIALVGFGSFFQGKATETSDIDLLLVMQSGYTITRKLYSIWDKNEFRIVSALNEVSPQFVQLPKSVRSAGSLWYEVSLHGKILWEKNEDTFHFLQNVREAIARREIIKVTHTTQSYWMHAERST